MGRVGGLYAALQMQNLKRWVAKEIIEAARANGYTSSGSRSRTLEKTQELGFPLLR